MSMHMTARHKISLETEHFHTCFITVLISFFCFVFLVALDQMRFKVGDYCDVCKTAVSYIDKLLENNATEEEIKEAVRKVCSFLPESMQSEVRSCASYILPLDLLCSLIWKTHFNLCFSVSTVWPVGHRVWASARPAAAPDVRPRLCVHGNLGSLKTNDITSNKSTLYYLSYTNHNCCTWREGLILCTCDS